MVRRVDFSWTLKVTCSPLPSLSSMYMIVGWGKPLIPSLSWGLYLKLQAISLNSVVRPEILFEHSTKIRPPYFTFVFVFLLQLLFSLWIWEKPWFFSWFVSYKFRWFCLWSFLGSEPQFLSVWYFILVFSAMIIQLFSARQVVAKSPMRSFTGSKNILDGENLHLGVTASSC